MTRKEREDDDAPRSFVSNRPIDYVVDFEVEVEATPTQRALRRGWKIVERIDAEREKASR
jgi:hypothetical protein